MIGALADSFTEPDGQTGLLEEASWVALFLVSVIIATRAWLLGVTVADGQLTLHGWLRDRSVDVEQIRRVQTVRYEGFWTKNSDTAWVNMLLLVLHGGDRIPVRELVGRPLKAYELGVRLSNACGTQPPTHPERAGRHVAR